MRCYNCGEDSSDEEIEHEDGNCPACGYPIYENADPDELDEEEDGLFDEDEEEEKDPQDNELDDVPADFFDGVDYDPEEIDYADPEDFDDEEEDL